VRFDLKKPCRHCPFSKHPRAIRFRCHERTAEIEEGAYRFGFVCHEHAHVDEDGYGFRRDGSSQHCFGALFLYLRDGGGGNVPFQWLVDDEDKFWDRFSLDDIKQLEALCFESPEDFIEGAVEEA